MHFITLAASSALEPSFQRIVANPSGESIEYIAFSSIKTLFATAFAKAPPLPPSPITIVRTGTFSPDISNILFAIASPCPLSSASIPGYAPGVSTKQIIGRLNFSACFISLIPFLYPSGDGIPKFLVIFCFTFLPFC